MGLGGFIVLLLIVGLAAYIFFTERALARKNAGSDSPFADLPKVSVHLVQAPQDMTERLTPPWQRTYTEQLKEQGYLLMGDYSYAALVFFWARVFIAPDKKSALLLVNWVEGKEGGKVVISNLEIYSFDGNSFILTACAQDGAVKLLTGANRPTEEQLSLHLKAVYAEVAARPIVEEHEQRLRDWEAKGAQVRVLTPANVLPSLSKVFS
jgi:hypothetical protein